MVHNKVRGHNDLKDDRLKNAGDVRQSNKAPTRGLTDDEQQENSRRTGKTGQNQKGATGKTNNQ